jgi:hypothetical protein
MNLIKAFLILSFLGVLIWAFRNRARVGLRAGVRILACMLTAIAIASIIDPGLPQAVANVLGVTRGTDLVLYLLTVVYVLTAVGTYFRFRDQDRRLVEVVRATCLRDAILTQGLPGADRIDEAGEAH